MSKLTDFPVYSARTKKRAKYGIVAGAIIVILVMSFMLSRPAIVEMDPGKISVTMIGQVFRDGVLIDERVKDDDLLVWNFLNVTQALLAWPDSSVYYASLVNWGGGGPFDFMFWNGTSTATVADNGDEMYEDVLCLGRFGSDNTAPTRDDNNLGTIKETVGLDSFTIGTDSFTLTWIQTSSQDFSWVESGFNLNWWSGDIGDIGNILMVRDTFSAIAVETDDTIVLNYRFNFGTGYTENYIKLLCYLLKGAVNGQTVTVSLTDVSGTSRIVTVYSPDDDSDWFGHVSDSNHGGHILVSDSSSGIPSRTAYRLLGSSLQTYANVVTDGNPNYDVLVSAVFVPTSEITIRAGAYERYTRHSGGDAYIMMFALAHGGVYVAPGTPVKAIFTVGM